MIATAPWHRTGPSGGPVAGYDFLRSGLGVDVGRGPPQCLSPTSPATFGLQCRARCRHRRRLQVGCLPGRFPAISRDRTFARVSRFPAGGQPEHRTRGLVCIPRGVVCEGRGRVGRARGGVAFQIEVLVVGERSILFCPLFDFWGQCHRGEDRGSLSDWLTGFWCLWHLMSCDSELLCRGTPSLFGGGRACTT